MRRAKAFRMARFDTGDGQVLDDDALLNEVLSGGVAGPAKEGDSALRNLGITSALKTRLANGSAGA